MGNLRNVSAMARNKGGRICTGPAGPRTVPVRSGLSGLKTPGFAERLGLPTRCGRGPSGVPGAVSKCAPSSGTSSTTGRGQLCPRVFWFPSRGSLFRDSRPPRRGQIQTTKKPPSRAASMRTHTNHLRRRSNKAVRPSPAKAMTDGSGTTVKLPVPLMSGIPNIAAAGNCALV